MSLSILKQYVKQYVPRPLIEILFKMNDRVKERSLGYRRFVDPKQTVGATGHWGTEQFDPALVSLLDLILRFDHRNPIAIDRAHNVFLIGAVLSKKPRNVLELGIGTGYLTMSLIHALRYNGVGQLTSVDNWFDTHGIEPKFGADLRAAGVKIVFSGEKEFLQQARSSSFDFLISDADHQNSAEWFDHHIRVVERDGLMFFHDTNLPDMFPGIAKLEARTKELGFPYYHFTESSRPDENCGRGMLFVINKKE
jgi:predicted O-methyltransferase YrrM